MTKSILRSVAAAAFIAASAFSFESHAEAGKVATINIQEIMTKSAAVQSINKQVEDKRNGYQSQISKKEEQLRTAEQELAKQRNVLSAEALEKKKKEFRDDVANAQKDMQSKRSGLEKALAKAMGEVQKSVQKIVEEISKEKGFDIAIATNQLIYAKPELDITPVVLEKLNKTLPDVKVSVEAASAKASTDEAEPKKK